MFRVRVVIIRDERVLTLERNKEADQGFRPIRFKTKGIKRYANERIECITKLKK